MKQLKDLRFVLIGFAVILVFVIARSTNKDLFKKDADSAVQAISKGENILLVSELTEHYLVVDLNDVEEYNANQFQHVINIPFQALLEKSNRKTLEETKEKIVLYSYDISTASKAWVVLNQLDFKDVFVLQTKENSEVFKYKFQPDTSAKLE